jgi:hypothetical protein
LAFLIAAEAPPIGEPARTGAAHQLIIIAGCSTASVKAMTAHPKRT